MLNLVVICLQTNRGSTICSHSNADCFLVNMSTISIETLASYDLYSRSDRCFYYFFIWIDFANISPWLSSIPFYLIIVLFYCLLKKWYALRPTAKVNINNYALYRIKIHIHIPKKNVIQKQNLQNSN